MSTNATMQEQFLNTLRQERCPVTVFLMNGFQLRGVVTGFDHYAVTVLSDGRQNMIYKHAISTIAPAQPIRLGDEPA